MAQSFAATVSAIAAKNKALMKAVRDEAAQRVVEVMQEPGPSVATVKKAVAIGAGLGKRGRSSTKAYGPVANPGGTGNLPVDLGILRASLVGVIGSSPPPIKETPKDGAAQTYDAGEINLIISNADLDDVITVAYTVAYARRVHYGFKGKDSLGRTYNQPARPWVTLAAQQWPRIVEETARDAKASVASR